MRGVDVDSDGGGGDRAARKAIEAFSCSDGQPMHSISRENGLRFQCGPPEKIGVVNMAELLHSNEIFESHPTRSQNVCNLFGLPNTGKASR